MNYQQQIKLKAWLRRPIITYFFLAIQTIVFLAMEFIPSNNIAASMGMYGPFVVYMNEWWRFITPIFIHFGLMHFAMNSLILYFMGEQIETLYGHWRFFIIYLFSGIMGNAASFAFNQAGVLSGGASTSLFGLFGALFMSFVFGLMDTSVDIWGHVGGIIGGLLLGNCLGLPKKMTDYSIHQRILSLLVFGFLLIICVLLGLKKYGLLV